MVYYKVGNRYLSEQAYQSHVDDNWVFGLFALGALAAGLCLYHLLPAELPKYLKFIALIVGGTLGGGLAGLFAPYIRGAVMCTLMLALLGGLGYGLWQVL